MPATPVPAPSPKGAPAEARVSLWPSLVIRTTDHRPAVVFLNGEEYAETSALWGFMGRGDFDPAIDVAGWPPSRSRFLLALRETLAPVESRPTLELMIRAPGEAERDHVLYVRSPFSAGALRLRVESRDGRRYRWTDYRPIGTEADMSRLERTLWFEPVPE